MSIEQQIGQALRSVREPTGKDVVEAGIVMGLQMDGTSATIVCSNPGFPDPIRLRIERDIQAAVASVAKLAGVRVHWQAPGQAPSQGGGEPGSQPPEIKHVIAVGSGKGGVGKSTIAASLAYALKHRGASVGLMDADVYGPSIPHMLGVHGPPGQENQRLIAPQVDDIKVMSMGFMIPAGQAVVWRGPMLHKAVKDFLFLVDWGKLDYLVVDLPPGTGDVVLSLSQQMPITGGVIVCTPQDVALLDARKALHMLQTVKIPCLGVVENMSYFCCPNCGVRTDIFSSGGTARWAAEAGLPFLGAVPLNIQVRINGDEGHIRDNFAADSPVRDDLLAIADRLIANIAANAPALAPTLEIV